jgi:hypothetical protein
VNGQAIEDVGVHRDDVLLLKTLAGLLSEAQRSSNLALVDAIEEVAVVDQESRADKSQKGALVALLKDCIAAVMDENPTRPAETLNPEQRKHARDVENLRWALSALHLPTLDAHILEMPHKMMPRTLHFWESFSGVLGNSLFHVYDLELRNAMERLHAAFRTSVSYGEMYHPTPGGMAYVFSGHDSMLTEDQDAAWKTIGNACDDMRTSLDDLLAVVRDRFIEVDISETNKAAWVEFIEFEKSAKKLFDK